jgi:hypothetical protein
MKLDLTPGPMRGTLIRNRDFGHAAAAATE